MRNLFKIPWSKSITACLAFTGFLLISYEIHGAAIEMDRDGRFIAYYDGTVLDTRTGLMWAAEDNGSDIDWPSAKKYCENFRGGGYSDWRMPTQEELAGLYDQSESRRALCGYDIHVATELIAISCYALWASETPGSETAHFPFYFGFRYWSLPSKPAGDCRALPVRSQWKFRRK